MAVPPALKGINQYILVAKQFATRDPVIAYFCKMYVVQEGIALAKSDPDAKGFLFQMMDSLQQDKKALKDEEAMNNDVVAQAHIEETALKLFDYADGEDRAGRFNKPMLKSFLTASHLFNVLNLKQFGEVSEEIDSKRKYAKWKAVEITRCFKNGITPTPGPPGGEDDEMGGVVGGMGGVSIQEPPAVGFNVQPDPGHYPPPPSGAQPGAVPVYPPPPSADHSSPRPTPAPRKTAPPPASSSPMMYPDPPPMISYSQQPPAPAASVPPSSSSSSAIPSSGLANLSIDQVTLVQKYCKFASSSLDYKDNAGAVSFLEKALRLLRTGKED